LLTVIYLFAFLSGKYGSGTARILPTYDYGVNFNASDAASPIITFPIPSRGPSHPHMTYQYGKELFIPDLVHIVTSKLENINSSFFFLFKIREQTPYIA
jgi:hypothetical protein